MPYEIIGSDTPFFVTPDRIKNEMTSIRTELNSLRDEIMNSGVRNNLKMYASNVVSEFDTYYERNYDSLIVGRSDWQEIVAWKNRVADLRQKFVTAGGETATSKEALKPPTPFFENVDVLGKPSVWGWAIIGGIGLWLTIELMGQKTESKKADMGLLRAAMGAPKSHKKGGY